MSLSNINNLTESTSFLAKDQIDPIHHQRMKLNNGIRMTLAPTDEEIETMLELMMVF
jgi:hypothetical protein